MSELMIHRQFAATFEKTAEPRTYGVTLSNGDTDRERDRLRPSGWVIPRRVPLLWAHDASRLPLGKVTDIRVEGDKLRGRIEFPPTGVSAFADEVVRLIDAGIIESTSVGFVPTSKPRANELGGLDFDGHELLELSLVNIPANAGATIDGRMDMPAMRKWLSDDDGIALELDAEDPPDEDIGVDSETFMAAFRDAMRTSVRAELGSAVRRGVSEAMQWRSRVGEPFADPAVRQHGHLGDEEVVDLDREDLRHILRGVVSVTLAEIVRAETQKALSRARGRVD